MTRPTDDKKLQQAEPIENETNWTVAPWRTANVDHAVAQRLSAQLTIPLRVAKWLCARTSDEAEATAWLEPLDRVPALDWSLFTDLEAAARRIWIAIEERERICIVGDYDVDGVTASAILAATLDVLGADWTCIIPHRVDDGYGLSEAIVDRAHDRGGRLLVTVDNGIRSVAAVQHAVSLGMDVVITDHHEPGDDVPAAEAVVHWARAMEQREVARLSGAGVARKLVDAVAATAPVAVPASVLTALAALQPWQDGLAALGALADVMPMRGENRRLVQVGIAALQTTAQSGFVALCQQAGVRQDALTASTILWNLTPRLNAAGRMGSAEVAFALLMAKDAEAAESAAVQVESWNRARRQETDRATREAMTTCEARHASGVPGGIVVAGPWPLGVVGIVAARLCDTYQRPTIVLADDGSGLLRGSGRAPDGFSLYDAVSKCAAELDHFGGHEAAIGCALYATHLDAFETQFADAAAALQSAPDVSAQPDWTVADDYLPLAESGLELVDWVAKLGPFGPENPPLTFYIGPVEVVRVKPLGQDRQHVRVHVREGASSADLVWFRADAAAFDWQPGMRISAVVELEENLWQGVRRAQLRVQTARVLPRALGREEFSRMYRLLRARRVVRLRDLEETREVAVDDLRVIFESFVELGFARREESAYHMIDHAKSQDLRESPSYRRYLAQAWTVK